MRKFFIVFILIICETIPSFSQQKDVVQQEYPDSIVPARLRKVIITESAIYLAGTYFLNNIWYKDHERVPFHFYNDNKGWMQLDKAGHMYASYYESYSGMRALRWAGVSKKKALWLGGTLGIILQTPIEVFDGIYEGYGFSAGDMVANAGGSALLISQELLWSEQRLILKFSYSSTPYPKYRPAYFGTSAVERFVSDYNGHTYWLSANLSDFLPNSGIPKWLNLALGIGADGMLGEFKNPTSKPNGEPLPEFERTRQLYFSVDVDLRKIPTKSKFLKEVFFNLNRLKIPAPAMEFNFNNGLKFHPVHF